PNWTVRASCRLSFVGAPPLARLPMMSDPAQYLEELTVMVWAPVAPAAPSVFHAVLRSERLPLPPFLVRLLPSVRPAGSAESWPFCVAHATLSTSPVRVLVTVGASAVVSLASGESSADVTTGVVPSCPYQAVSSQL